MSEAERVAELVRGDLGEVAPVPAAAVRPAVVEHDLADPNAIELDAGDRALLARHAEAADGEHSAAAERVGDLVERIVEDDAVAAAAAGKGDRLGERAGIVQ